MFFSFNDQQTYKLEFIKAQYLVSLRSDVNGPN